MTSVRGRVRAVVAIGFAMAAIWLPTAPAGASTGVSIDVGSIAITEVLKAGEQYRLPTFGVRNPGTEATTYQIVVTYLADQQQMRPPETWFTFDPGSITLDGGQTRAVSARIEIAPGAEPGEYLALIGPRIANEGTGAQVGAGAAAKVTFTVEPSSWLEGVLRQIWRFIGANPWVVAIVALLVLLVVLWFLRRRFAFSVARKS
jgi:hypothetical protein